MKNLKFLTLLILIAMVFSGCKKYPDDDVLIQWHKPDKRILGSWSLSSLTIDGKDSTQAALDTICNGGINLSEPKSYEGNLLIAGHCSGGPTTIADGRWRFTNKKKNIVFDFYYYNTHNIGAFLRSGVEWKIMELDKHTMKLTAQYDNFENELCLKK